MCQREGERAKSFRLLDMSVHVLTHAKCRLGSASSLLLAKGNQGKPRPVTGSKVLRKSLKFLLQFCTMIQRIINEVLRIIGSQKNTGVRHLQLCWGKNE